MTGEANFVQTTVIRQAVKGGETKVLDAIGVDCYDTPRRGPRATPRMDGKLPCAVSAAVVGDEPGHPGSRRQSDAAALHDQAKYRRLSQKQCGYLYQILYRAQAQL
jgi:hypothetical protein